MKEIFKIPVFYCLLFLVLSTYSFTGYFTKPNLLIGINWHYYSEYSNPCCGGHGWDKVSNLDSKKYFKLLDHGRIDGDYFYQSTYTVKDSMTLAVINTNKMVVEYHYIIDNDTLYFGPGNFGCKEGCGWKFIKVQN